MNSECMPVFIGGFRSGTTLLVNLLGMHQDASAWFETKELCECLRWQRVLQDPQQAAFESALINPPQPEGFTAEAVRQRMATLISASFRRQRGAKHSGKAAHERYPLGNDRFVYSEAQALQALDEWYRQVNSEAGQEHAAAANGQLISRLGRLQCDADAGLCWINKTPEIIRFAPELRAALGPCRIISLIRNGLDVVSSALELGWGDAGTLAFKWRALIEDTRNGMQENTDDLLELRYESLLENPVRELNRALAFCGLSEEAADIVGAFRRDFGDDAFARSRKRPQADPAVREQFARQAGELQQQLGYPL